MTGKFMKTEGGEPTRPQMRDASARAAAIRESNGHILQAENKFDIDPSAVPDGWTYEWKRRTIMGKEDPGHMVALAAAGWEAVPASRHTEMMPSGWDANFIERDGMVLMERPQEITDEARAMQRKAARDQRIQKEQQLTSAGPEGITKDFDSNPKNMKQKIGSHFEAIPVPDK